MFAYFGPQLFHREIIRRAHSTTLGYQFGRTIFWRLSQRAAWLIAAASITPLLALTLPDPIDIVWLTISTLLIAFAWLTYSPGRQVGLLERPGQGALPVFELRANPGLFRTIVIFLGCGVIPALLIGAGINQLLNLCA